MEPVHVRDAGGRRSAKARRAVHVHLPAVGELGLDGFDGPRQDAPQAVRVEILGLQGGVGLPGGQAWGNDEISVHLSTGGFLKGAKIESLAAAAVL